MMKQNFINLIKDYNNINEIFEAVYTDVELDNTFYIRMCYNYRIKFQLHVGVEKVLYMDKIIKMTKMYFNESN